MVGRKIVGAYLIMPRGHGQKMTREERERALSDVARLDRYGYSQSQIAAKVGISQSQVSSYLKTIKLRYINATLPTRAESVQKALSVLNDLRQEAYEAYERSKEDAEKHVHEEGENGRGSYSKDVETREGRLPAVEYLRLIRDLKKDERDLLGLDAPKVVDVSGNVTTVNWDLLLQEIPQGPLPDTVNDRLELMIADVSVQSGAVPPLPIGLKELPQTNGHPPTPTEEE